MKTKTKLDNLRGGKSPRALAEEFVTRLKNCLTENQILAIRRRNIQPEYKDACASHDFIDANMVMSDAFEAVIGHEIDADNGADSCLWNAAWDIAKRDFLTAGKRVPDGREEVKAAGDILAATLRGIRDALAIEGGFKPTIKVIDQRLTEWEDV